MFVAKSKDLAKFPITELVEGARPPLFLAGQVAIAFDVRPVQAYASSSNAFGRPDSPST